MCLRIHSTHFTDTWWGKDDDDDEEHHQSYTCIGKHKLKKEERKLKKKKRKKIACSIWEECNHRIDQVNTSSSKGPSHRERHYFKTVLINDLHTDLPCLISVSSYSSSSSSSLCLSTFSSPSSFFACFFLERVHIALEHISAQHAAVHASVCVWERERENFCPSVLCLICAGSEKKSSLPLASDSKSCVYLSHTSHKMMHQVYIQCDDEEEEKEKDASVCVCVYLCELMMPLFLINTLLH